jgi:outer membrane receptor protein involved in Fe transport
MRQSYRWVIFAILVCALAVSVSAQTSTATIRGKVTNESGAGIANAEISAVGAASGFVRTVHTGPDGSYTLNGLTPGELNIVVASPGLQPRSESVRVLVGQNLEMNFSMAGQQVLSEAITVVGNQMVETRTSEAATNVTPQQMEDIPQQERNFLNFAALAPGIRLSKDPLRKTISGDAQNSEQTNVFIDGVSFKNDVLQGGAVGQDASRGNLFPQNAVQEFRVITQNYSAQYEKASSAIITAITKSGGNSFDGSAFVLYQPKQWVAPSPKGFGYSTLAANDAYHRYQGGFSFGGPIIRDKLHYFASYEQDQEHATSPVHLDNAAFASRFAQYTGIFPSPFRSTLGFGKLSWQPMQNQIVDFSGTYRKEQEVRDFGNNVSFESANAIRNSVYGSTLRHQWNSSTALNQASLSWQKYSWNPTATNPDLIGQDFQGAIRIGGSATYQKFDQRRIEFRDDYNFGTFHWQGDHSVQVGGNLDSMKYDVTKRQAGNPLFHYRNDPANGYTYDLPFEVEYGFGNPNLSVNNREYGIYAQDTWAVNQKFTANLGIRYDYESNGFDTKYVTPANIVAGLTGKVSSDYFSTGSNRSQFKGAIQPRLGFTYDVKGDNHTVLFAAAGRFYDRLFLNGTLDERYRLQYPVYRIQFSPDGRAGTVKFDPKYLSAAGLDALIAQGGTSPEIYLVNNNTKPPYSNQYNIGIRQMLGSWNGSVSYNRVRGYRGITYVSATGICCSALVPGFGNVILSDPEGKKYRYDALFLSLDRPYNSQSRWGAHLAWTHAKAEQTGNDLFSLDLPSAAAYGFHAVPGSEKDRVVATGTVRIPFDVRFSTIISLGTGAAFNVLDFSQGFDLAARLRTHPFSQSIYPEKKGGFADRSIDFRLEKTFGIIGGASIGVIGEMFNAGNFKNYGCLNNFVGPEGNPNLGDPGCVITLGRREQLGLRVNF